MITETVTPPEENKEEINILEVGNRELTEDQIEHVDYIFAPITAFPLNYEIIDKYSFKLAEMLRDEDLTFETSLKIWERLKFNVEILKKAYRSTEQKCTRSISEIINSDDIFSDPKRAKKVERELINTIRRPRHEGMITGSFGSDKLLVIDPRDKTVKIEYVKEVNGKDYGHDETIIMACPRDLVVYDNPVAHETRQFQCLWDTNVSNRPLRTGPAPAAEIAEEMSASGYIINKRKGEDTVKIAFNTMIAQNYATMKSEVEAPGFYWNDSDGSISVVKYELPPEVPHEDLEQGIQTLEEYATYFKNRLDKLAHVFKWGLISPFIFAIKQMGGWVKWPYLYGNGGTGKSKGFADMVLYMWDEPDNTKNDFGGSGFDTEARIGEKLKLSTFPIAVAEPAGLFERKGPSELIKTAIEQITSRGKFMGKHYKTIPAYAPVIFTANQRYPDDDAFDRRLDGMLFTRVERKTDEEKAEFNNKFQIENTKQCRLHDLKAIAHYIAIEICNDPSLLEGNWQETINMLLVRLYTEIGYKMPEWLLSWSKIETMEDMDDLHKERIRIFLQKQINEAYGRIQVLDDEGRPKNTLDDTIDVKTTDDFTSRVWIVLNNRKIPWLLLDKKDNVIITMGFIDELKDHTCVKDSLQGIADLLGWKKLNSRVRSVGFAGHHIKVHRKKFTRFVFPECDDLDGKCDEI